MGMTPDRDPKAEPVVGCICGVPVNNEWSIKPDCPYHVLAAKYPDDHRIPRNCPTYWDGCNCSRDMVLSDQDLAEIETVLMDDPVHLPTCAVFFAHLADPDCDCGFTATTRRLIAEIRRLRADIETELGNDLCGFPMWPGGPTCQREPGHAVAKRSAHWGISGDRIQWSYTACWKPVVLPDEPGDRVCILPQGHEPTRDCNGS